MKALRAILLLLVGILIGITGTIGLQHDRRGAMIRALPSLDDRKTLPIVDEFPAVRLLRRDGRLEYDVRDSMGGPQTDFRSALAMEAPFSSSDPIWMISFEPGVTMEDLESTLGQLSELGVKRYFLGFHVYGKVIGEIPTKVLSGNLDPSSIPPVHPDRGTMNSKRSQSQP